MVLPLTVRKSKNTVNSPTSSPPIVYGSFSEGVVNLGCLFAQPVFVESAESRKGLEVFLSIRDYLNGNDVVQVTNSKAFHLDMLTPGFLEPFDSVRGKDQIQIKWAVL